MLLKAPRISIITPSLNRAGYIVCAIQSVLAQNYPNTEHIIVDGGSTDGTLDVLARYNHLIVVSEADRGMYDALNKGLKLTQGEIIGFLNTDDLYAPGIFKDVAEHFADEAIEAVAGKARILREGENGNRQSIMEITPSAPDHLLEHTILGIPAFNAWFFRRNVFEAKGGFDARYRIAADREFMIRLALSGIRYEAVDRVVYEYLAHPGSLTIGTDDANWTKTIEEHLKMTDVYLNRVNTPEEAKRYFRQMRTINTLDVAVSSLYKRELRKVWMYSREGVRYDWAWPLRLVLRAFRRLCRWTRKPLSS